MKYLIIILLFVTACSDNDEPKPQVPCAQLKIELDAAQQALVEHKAKGSVGNQDVWLNTLNNLIRTRDAKQAEYTTRRCL